MQGAPCKARACPIFSTQLKKPDSPPLTLKNTDINFCDSVKYLGIGIDCKLRF